MTGSRDGHGTRHADSTRERARDRSVGGVNVAAVGRARDRTRGAEWGALEDTLAWCGRVSGAVAYRWVQASFAFVFFYFGLQKWPVIQGASPVRPTVQAFVEAVGFGSLIPLAPATGLLLIGIYEVTLGVLWAATIVEERWLGTSRVFLGAALMTVAHQVVTFLPLVVVPAVAFRETTLWLPLLGTFPFPVALDWLSAFILKNLLFVGAFLYAFAEWSGRYGPAARPPVDESQ